MRTVLTEIKRIEDALPAVREAGIAALHRLLAVAKGDTGQSGVVARFLLGVYNGSDFKFDLTDLRYLDSNLVEDCLALLRMDSNPEKEVHQYIENGQEIWQGLRRTWINDDGQLFAEIKKSSKYAHQADWCRNSPCGYPFRVRIEVDSLDDFIVKGGVGGRYRISDLNLYLMDGGKKIRVH